MNIYDQMLAFSSSGGLPHAFRTDLTEHDKRSVTEQHPGRPFAWLLYDSGTHLVWLDGDMWEVRKTLRIVAECFTGGDHEWFHSDGSTLTPTTYTSLRDMCWDDGAFA